MAVFRIEKTRDYTVMSNHHLKDKTLTLKSKGLLSMMLSLPEEWNYTTRGLAAICREGVDSIGAALKELETRGDPDRADLCIGGDLVLTFEKVLEVFKDYLASDDMYEIVMTSHGYTMLEWDCRMDDWVSLKLCKTPQDMADTLLCGYEGYLEYQATLGRRELTENDLAQIETQRQVMLSKLQQI